MPTYDYKCKKCSHTFEYFQTMSDALLELCPECKGDLRRLISGGSGLIFKGSGFYLTDYKNDNPASKLCKLHFYAFGGIKKTSEWLNMINNSPLDINFNNEFKPISD